MRRSIKNTALNGLGTIDATNRQALTLRQIHELLVNQFKDEKFNCCLVELLTRKGLLRSADLMRSYFGALR